MNPGDPEVLRELQRDELRLRVRLAAVLLGAICAFALFLSWFAQGDPLRPLVAAEVSLIALFLVYAVGVSVAAIYARWIRVRRDPAVLAYKAARSGL